MQPREYSQIILGARQTKKDVCREVNGTNASVKHKGYTKAIDMWSVGCVATALLTGATPISVSPSVDSRRPSLKTKQAVFAFDLKAFFKSRKWLSISKRAQAFIKGLLVLDENTRMTATEAIQHHWFTNRHVKDAFDAVYAKAVAGWECRKPALDGEVIEIAKAFTAPTVRSLGACLCHAECEQTSVVRKKKKKQKAQLPIEPHYHPYHRRIAQILCLEPLQHAASPTAEKVTSDPQKSTDKTSDTCSKSGEPTLPPHPPQIKPSGEPTLPRTPTRKADQKPQTIAPKRPRARRTTPATSDTQVLATSSPCFKDVSHEEALPMLQDAPPSKARNGKLRKPSRSLPWRRSLSKQRPAGKEVFEFDINQDSDCEVIVDSPGQGVPKYDINQDSDCEVIPDSPIQPRPQPSKGVLTSKSYHSQGRRYPSIEL
jgi:serine/threonine protein kinase